MSIVHLTRFSLSLLSLSLALILSQAIAQRSPTFVKSPPKLLYFKDNDNITLECEAIGNPEVTYYWTKNGQKIDSIKGNILRISSATHSDEGSYQCIAENTHGSKSTETTQLRRAVLEPIGPTPRTISLYVTEGERFKILASSFKVVPESSSYRDYSWLSKTGGPIILGSRTQIADNGDLHFAYAIAADDLDGDLYVNTLNNSFTQTTIDGNYTRVNVKSNANATEFAPSLAFSSGSETIVMEGETVTLRCFFYGKPEPSINWLRSDGMPLPAMRFHVSNYGTELTLLNVTKSQENEYHCYATNTLGSATHNLTLQVQGAMGSSLNAATNFKITFSIISAIVISLFL